DQELEVARQAVAQAWVLARVAHRGGGRAGRARQVEPAGLAGAAPGLDQAEPHARRAVAPLHARGGLALEGRPVDLPARAGGGRLEPAQTAAREGVPALPGAPAGE